VASGGLLEKKLEEDFLELVFTKNKTEYRRLCLRIYGQDGVVKNNTISEKVKYLVRIARI
jgi:hypothetical protein